MALRQNSLFDVAERQRTLLRAAKAEEMTRLVENYPFLEVYHDSIPKAATIKAAIKNRMCDGIIILFN